MYLLKKFTLGLLLALVLLAALLVINPQFADNHDTPYLNLQQENAGPPPAHSAIQQRIILYGDAGSSSLDPWQASMQKIADRASQLPGRTAIVALGDNIYYQGYPNKEEEHSEWDKGQLKSISRLDAQLKIASVSQAQLFFVPGNHDWYAGSLDGMREHIRQFAKNNGLAVQFRPKIADQPEAIDSVDLGSAAIVFVDSSALLASDDNALNNAMNQLRANLEQLREQSAHKPIVIVQHHPLETMGQHGGYFSHFAYWFFIRFLDLFMDVTAEDTAHPNYQRVIRAFETTLQPFENIIHAAGHDHSLQVFRRPHNHAPEYLLVSGAANTSKLSGVWHNDNTRFALSQEGFLELNITGEGTHLQAFDIRNDDPLTAFWLSF